MDSYGAFTRGEMARQAGNKMKVFDWNKAAELIKARNPTHVSAGLSGDWDWTGGAIFENGKPVPSGQTYTYLASLWADPEIDIDGDVIECWKYEDDLPGWDAQTYWPASALAILSGN